METPNFSSSIGDHNLVTAVVQGNTVQGSINITQILGHSADYAALTSQITETQEWLADIPDTKPDKRLEVSQKLEGLRAQEQKFKEDVLRLAETFSKINIDGERLTKAKEHFEAGRFREADAILNAEDMTRDQDALLHARDRKERELGDINKNLTKNADEWLVKANINQLQWDDPDWFETTVACFEKSLKAQRTRDNLWKYALFLYKHNQPHKVEQLYLELLELVQADESDLARTAMNLGLFYYTVQKMPEAETMYLRSLEIRERLAKANPAQFEPDLAMTLMNLGLFYETVQKMPKAEMMYFRSLDDAETMYLRAFEISERLAKANPAQFEPDLATTLVNLGVFYQTVQKMPEAETMYLRSLEIYERLAKANPAQFEPDLATTAMNYGFFLFQNGKAIEAEERVRRANEVFRRVAADNHGQYDLSVSRTCGLLGIFKKEKGEAAAARALFEECIAIASRYPDVLEAQQLIAMAKQQME